MMKKLVILSSFFLLATSAYASSEASVNVKNNVSSSSESNVTSRTDITVETNGQVTHYDSDEPGDISVKSVNGVSEIKVNGQTVTGSPISPTIKPSATPKESERDDAKERRISKLEEVEERIIEQLKRPFTILERIIFFWRH